LAKRAHVEKTVGPWAKQKLDALENYLSAYMKVMKNQPFKLFYIDAFAGAGVVRVRDSAGPSSSRDDQSLFTVEVSEQDREQVAEYITGSPLRALSLQRKFDHYRFVDLDPHRVADLRTLAAEYGDCEVRVIEGEANDRVQFIASHFDNRLWRGVAFLDPYGAHLHWKTLEALARTRKFDVIINFPLGMTINRLIKRDEDIPPVWQKQLDLCFGSSDWRELAFETRTGLFGDLRAKRPDAADRLLAYYVDRLEAIFGNVSQPSLVKNTQGSPLYYLIWAGARATGKPIADHILGLGDKVRVRTSRREQSIDEGGARSKR
jgi:three-Cys-motif partner protein